MRFAGRRHRRREQPLPHHEYRQHATAPTHRAITMIIEACGTPRSLDPAQQRGRRSNAKPERAFRDLSTNKKHMASLRRNTYPVIDPTRSHAIACK